MSEIPEDVAVLPDDDEVELEDELAPDEDAPYGYTIDRKTGERRPKKVSGRPRVVPPVKFEPGSTPSLDELKATPKEKPEDRAPQAASRPKRGRGTKKDKPKVEAPPFRAGPIAAGMNKLYARAGKIIRIWDQEIGSAVIECTRKDTPDDVTVGEAWEELAKVNPRVRVFLIKMISGGAYTQLFMAHLPIFLAIAMKDGIRKHIPFMKVATEMLGDDEQGAPSPFAEAFGNMTPEDAQQMMEMGMGLMGQMGVNLSRNGQMPRAATVDEAEDA